MKLVYLALVGLFWGCDELTLEIGVYVDLGGYGKPRGVWIGVSKAICLMG